MGFSTLSRDLCLRSPLADKPRGARAWPRKSAFSERSRPKLGRGSASAKVLMRYDFLSVLVSQLRDRQGKPWGVVWRYLERTCRGGFTIMDLGNSLSMDLSAMYSTTAHVRRPRME